VGGSRPRSWESLAIELRSLLRLLCPLRATINSATRHAQLGRHRIRAGRSAKLKARGRSCFSRTPPTLVLLVVQARAVGLPGLGRRRVAPWHLGCEIWACKLTEMPCFVPCRRRGLGRRRGGRAGGILFEAQTAKKADCSAESGAEWASPIWQRSGWPWLRTDGPPKMEGRCPVPGFQLAWTAPQNRSARKNRMRRTDWPAIGGPQGPRIAIAAQLQAWRRGHAKRPLVTAGLQVFSVRGTAPAFPGTHAKGCTGRYKAET